MIFDTAGRTTVDEALMQEAADIASSVNPHETLLVVDSLTGQDAVRTAEAFDERLKLTGIVLTRLDGDGRGGAALSMRAVTGKPIKLVGTGEKAEALEEFHPDRIASRILGMGDIVSLVEKASQEMDAAKAEAMAKKLKIGTFDLDDLAGQLQQMIRMGGLGGLMGMMPGMGKLKQQMGEAKLDDKVLKRQIAIIHSMTKQERRKPDILKASRKKRIAKGSGVDVADVNKLLKMHRQMADMMKMMGKKKGLLGSLFGGGVPTDPLSADAASADYSPEKLEALAKQAGNMKLPPGMSLPGGLGNLPGMPGNLPKGLPGLGGSPFGKKK